MIHFLLHHRRPVALLLLLAVLGTVFLWQQPPARYNAPTPPAQVIIKQAASTSQGVRIEWLEGQAGAHPISGYLIERSRGSGDFTLIARAEKISSHYLDTEGQPDDVYRIIAEDDQQPPLRSPASGATVAAATKPGGAVLTAASPSHVDNSLIASSTATPDTKANTLQTLIAQAFTDFDTALVRNDFESARSKFAVLQDYQRHALDLLTHLSPANKTSLAHMCDQNLPVFEANLHTLTERDQFDGMLVLAGCDAIRQGAE